MDVNLGLISKSTLTEGVWEQNAEENIWAQCGWNKNKLQILRSEELYSPQNIIRMIMPRRLRWAEHLARIRRIEMHAVFQ
jgi:hypothetical protein